MDLRPYQQEASDAIVEQLDEHGSTLVVCPTGGGKTVIFGHVAGRYPGNVLVAAHREELIFQARDTLKKMLPNDDIRIEMGEMRAMRRARPGQKKYWTDTPRVVVASIQSLHEKRIEAFDPKYYDLLIIDEAHHAAKKNKTYRRMLDHFQQNDRLKVLGVTATPDRADEASLGQVFESVAFDYGLRDAINDGWLVPIEQQMVHVEDLDFSQINTRMGDLAAGQLDEIMAQEEMVHKVVTPTLDIVGEKKTLVFTAGVAQAHRMAEVINRHRPNHAVALDGKTDRDERRHQIERFSQGEYQYLIGCGIFLEGFDEPTIEVIVQARPTKSRSLYAQIIGRGTRVLPNLIEGVRGGEFWRLPTVEERKAAIAGSDKPAVLVVDYVGNAGRHKLVYSGDVLAGNEYTDEEVEAAEQIAKEAGKKGEKTSVDEALMEARRQIESQLHAKRQRVIAKARYSVRQVNPFDVFDTRPGREPGWHKGREPSEKQIAMIKKAGVPLTYDQREWWIGDPTKPSQNPQRLTFWTASQTISLIMDRRKKNLCTFKQASLLAKYGEDPNVGFKEASAIIDQIAKSGWKPRPETVERNAQEMASQGAQ